MLAAFKYTVQLVCLRIVRGAALVLIPVLFFSAAGLLHASGPGADRTREITLNELEFKDATVQDAVRVISELTGVNIVATEQAGRRKVTLFVRNLTVADVVDSICRISGLWYRLNPKTGIFIVMTTGEYQRDIVVFRNEPTRMFQLEYLNVGIAARTIYDLFGERVELMGKGDRYYGDDYEVGDTYDEFEEDVDDGSEDSDSSRTTTSRTKTDSRTGRDRPSLESGNLTARQLDLLEQDGEKDLQTISESRVGRVSQRSEAPIYITVNRMHNMLFVRTADEKAMEEIAKIIRESDKQVPEVLLEMKILEIQVTDQFQSAFDISYIDGSETSGLDDGHVINPLNGEAATVGSSLLGLGNFDTISDASMVFQALSGSLRMRLQLLQEDNNIKTLATPLLLAANNHPARLFIGEETVLTTGFTTETVAATNTSGVVVNNYVAVPETSTEEIGNTLTILPSINADRSVVLRIVHENSSVNSGGGSIPMLVGDSIENVSVDTVTTSKLEGTFLAQDGMTVAVGGMMRTSYTDGESKVPVLGDIPIISFFFKQKNKLESKTELILLITPYVLNSPRDGNAVSRSRLSELSSQPNGMDLRREDLIRPDSTESAPDNKLKITGSGIVSEEQRNSFVKLTRTAVIQARMPATMRKPHGRIVPVVTEFTGPVPVLNRADIDARSAGAWTDGAYYVTAVKLTNMTSQSIDVDANEVKGSWLAATLEDQKLTPAGEPGDFTYLYLISEKDLKNNFPGETEP